MVEELSKVASNTVAAMKESPGLLSVIVLQCATLAMLYFASSATAERAQQRELVLLERCLNARGIQP